MSSTNASTISDQEEQEVERKVHLIDIINDLNNRDSKHNNEAPLRTSIYGEELSSSSSGASSLNLSVESSSDEDHFKHLNQNQEE